VKGKGNALPNEPRKVICGVFALESCLVLTRKKAMGETMLWTKDVSFILFNYDCSYASFCQIGGNLHVGPFIPVLQDRILYCSRWVALVGLVNWGCRFRGMKNRSSS
jgi:hypothetical protein